MKKSTPIILALALVSCSKEEVAADLRVEVTCKRCTVVVTSPAGVVHDTIPGRLVYTWQDGCATIDTVPETAAYNLKARGSDSGSVSACGQEAIVIELSGAYKATSTGAPCTSISYP
jgi:hypothetical protein